MKITDTSSLDKAMQTILTDVGKVSDFTLKRCAHVVKTRVENNLRSIQKKHYNKNGHELKRPREIHMADDVVIKFTKDKFGYRIIKVQGGKKTGTLWHVVNDGTFRNRATHFMDNAISSSEEEIQQILDEELRKVF
jgi:HK97 gp10 family phage protein